MILNKTDKYCKYEYKWNDLVNNPVRYNYKCASEEPKYRIIDAILDTSNLNRQFADIYNTEITKRVKCLKYLFDIQDERKTEYTTKMHFGAIYNKDVDICYRIVNIIYQNLYQYIDYDKQNKLSNYFIKNQTEKAIKSFVIPYSII